MLQVKRDLWLNPDAVVSAHCLYEPEITHESDDGMTPELRQPKQYVLTLTLCDGSKVTFTEMKEIVGACKILGISKPKTWAAQPARE